MPLLSISGECEPIYFTMRTSLIEVIPTLAASSGGARDVRLGKALGYSKDAAISAFARYRSQFYRRVDESILKIHTTLIPFDTKVVSLCISNPPHLPSNPAMDTIRPHQDTSCKNASILRLDPHAAFHAIHFECTAGCVDPGFIGQVLVEDINELPSLHSPHLIPKSNTSANVAGSGDFNVLTMLPSYLQHLDRCSEPYRRAQIALHH